MQPPRNRKHKLSLECLETRRLLAVDLSIEVDSVINSTTEDAQTRVVRVFNNGDEVATDAVVQAVISEQLDAATWSRRAGFAKVVHGKTTVGSVAAQPIRANAEVAQPIGDANADGLTDYVAWVDGSWVVALGFEQLGTSAAVPFPPTLLGHVNIVPVGDVNSDGNDDFAFNTQIVLGGPDNFQSGAQFQAIAVEVGIPTAHEGASHAQPVGDVNGDGIDDVAFQMSGIEFFDATNTFKADAEVLAGASIVFGGSYLTTATSVNAEQEGAVLRVTTPYFERPALIAQDANGDGTSDIILRRNSASGLIEELIVFGGEQLNSVDFGRYSTDWFDGENGFLHQASTVSSDGRTVPPPSTETVAGVGDILEVVTIPPGESLIYKFSGQLGAHAADAFPASVAASTRQAEFDLSDNHAGTSSSSYVTVDAAASEFIIGESATLDVVLENLGPSAANISLADSVSSSLANASISIDTTASFPNEINTWLPKLGPRESGDRVNLNFGADVGGLGDINGDGHDEIYVLSGETGEATIYFGGENFGTHHRFMATTPPLAIATRPPIGSSESDAEADAYSTQELLALGDINADGFDDFSVVGRRLRDGRQLSLTVLGQATFESQDGSLNLWSADDWTTSASPRVVGDINGDGIQDILHGQTVHFGDETEITFRHLLRRVEVFPVGDLNGDTFDDLAVTLSGKELYLFAGSEAGLDVVNLQSDHQLTRVLLDRPEAVSVAGMDRDINGDGVEDLVLSVQTSFEQHDIRVVYGGTDVFTENDISPTALPISFVQGTAVGDINGDQIDDIAVGRLDRVEIYFGGNEFAQPSMVVHGDGEGEYPGMSVAAGFDINGDGLEDMLVGNPQEPPVGELADTGEAFMLFGRAETHQITTSLDDVAITISPGEQLQVRVQGVTTSETLSRKGVVSVTTLDDQLFLNPFATSAEFEVGGEFSADLDSDGIVGFSDFLIFRTNFGKELATHEEGDLNLDGIVDFTDFLILRSQFGTVAG